MIAVATMNFELTTKLYWLDCQDAQSLDEFVVIGINDLGLTLVRCDCQNDWHGVQGY